MPGTRRTYITPVDEKAIGARIRELRIQQGLTQHDLANELGIKQSAISDYENGIVRIHAALIGGFSKALKISADGLLGLEKDPQQKPTDRRFLRRIERLHRLSRRDQEMILGTIDAFLSKAS